MNGKRVTRSQTDRKLCGVCGGLGEYFSIDSTLIRLLFVALLFLSFGTWLLFYIIAAIIIPEDV